MKNRKIAIVILSLIFILKLNAQHHIKVIDSETNEPVSFAVISVKGENIIGEASLDGICIIEPNKNLTYKLTRLGYKELSLSGEQLLNSTEILMEIQPIEINPIIISAKAAWENLNKAIENTYKLIPEERFYLSCWQNDKIDIEGKNVVSAKAIFVSKTHKISKAGKGSNSLTKIKGLKVINPSNFNVNTLNKFRYYNVPVVNQFAIGANSETDNELLYYYLDTNDTCVIIGYKPKSAAVFKGKTVLSSGRFVINKAKWTITRIDSDLSPDMIIKKNMLMGTKSDYQYKSFKRTILLDKKGIIRKLYEMLEFTIKKQDSNTSWTNTLVQVYKEIPEKDYLAVDLKTPNFKSIIYQKPFFNAEFDAEFKNGFTDK